MSPPKACTTPRQKKKTKKKPIRVRNNIMHVSKYESRPEIYFDRLIARVFYAERKILSRFMPTRRDVGDILSRFESWKPV